MSDHQHIRVHLRQVIMVGKGNQARFAKVLTGIRRYDLDQQFTNGEALIAVEVYGCVIGASNSFIVTPVERHTHLLSSDNILSLEDMAQPSHKSCPPSEPVRQQNQTKTQTCSVREEHAAHAYHDPRVMINCPGFPIPR